MRAWIEIWNKIFEVFPIFVALFMRAWIEIKPTVTDTLGG